MDHKQYAKAMMKQLKEFNACPYQSMTEISRTNDLGICEGKYTAWEVLELMLMLEHYINPLPGGEKK